MKTLAIFKGGAALIIEVMLLRATIRKKDGKEDRYFSVVENKRVADGQVVQRHVLYLGEINDSGRWRGVNRSRSLKRVVQAANAVAIP